MDSEDFPNFAIDISDENLVDQAEQIDRKWQKMHVLQFYTTMTSKNLLSLPKRKAQK